MGLGLASAVKSHIVRGKNAGTDSAGALVLIAKINRQSRPLWDSVADAFNNKRKVFVLTATGEQIDAPECYQELTKWFMEHYLAQATFYAQDTLGTEKIGTATIV